MKQLPVLVIQWLHDLGLKQAEIQRLLDTPRSAAFRHVWLEAEMEVPEPPKGAEAFAKQLGAYIRVMKDEARTSSEELFLSTLRQHLKIVEHETFFQAASEALNFLSTPQAPVHEQAIVQFLQTVLGGEQQPISVEMWWEFVRVCMSKEEFPKSQQELRTSMKKLLATLYQKQILVGWPPGASHIMESALSSLLEEREVSVLRMRYGLSDSVPLSLEDIVKWLGNVSRERVRQIEAKALRKLRHPLRREILRRQFLLSFRQALCEKEERIAELMDPGDDDAVSERRYQHLLLQPPTELDLSVRVSNCLIAHGIGSIGVLRDLTVSDLARNVPNLGRKGAKEVKEALEEHGLKLKE